jgi:FtsP/CotA-like multicopper oxidase with cupredoxin domain
MPKLTRRSVLAALAPVVGAGAAAKLGGLSPGARAANGNGMDGSDGMAMGGRAAANGRAHGAFGFRRGAVVDHAANGFNPTEVLRDFDWGRTRRLPGGRVVREWQLIAQEKEIEVAPGVKFAAWTYNGRVPGPTLRCREGELLRIRLVNGSPTPHTIHFHGIHPAAMDGVPGAGAGVIEPGARTTYEFEARPFGLHLYHCHVNPLADHISKGLYGAFIVDPAQGRPEADEMVMVLNGFDTNFDRANEIYAANTVAFHYANEPIEVGCNELVRIYLANLLEFDLVNSLHLHGNLFDYYPTGTALRPSEYTDTIMQCQGQRGIVEMRFPSPGNFMFHAHQSEFTELGWMGFFNAGQGGGSRAAAARLCDLSGKDRT